MNEQMKKEAPMVRTYRKKYSAYNEVIEVNTETGEFRQFFYVVPNGHVGSNGLEVGKRFYPARETDVSRRIERRIRSLPLTALCSSI
ncbi:hypothetical protein ABES02_29630 [Neobacillus pocheonensis]|uniref:hypothetical protein n=1 Tax=Neobacillus pocheonensis TaxID=363869 RepID=UPI003D2C90C0